MRLSELWEEWKGAMLMPTQEDRLTTLEQRTSAYIEEVNENLATTIGLVHILAGDVKKVHQRLGNMQENLQETLSIHVDATNAHFDHLQKHADKTDKDLAEIKTALAQILERLPEKP